MIFLQLSLYFLHSHFRNLLDLLILHYLPDNLSFSHFLELLYNARRYQLLGRGRDQSQVSVHNLVKVFSLCCIVIFAAKILDYFRIFVSIQALFADFFQKRRLRCYFRRWWEVSSVDGRLWHMILEAWTRGRNRWRRIDAIPKSFAQMGCWRSVLLTFFVPFCHAFPIS